MKPRKYIRHRRPGPLSRLEDKLTAMVAQLVKIRDRWTCQRCCRPVRDDAQAHHVIHKSEGNILRWVKNNLVTVCPTCHDWAEKHPAEAEAWFANRFPDRWAEIEPQRHKVCRWYEMSLEELESLFEEELARAGSDPWVM